MSTSSLRNLVLAALVTGLVLGPAIEANDRTAKERELQTLLRKIDKLKQAIDVKEDSKSQYIKQLKAIERNIGDVNRKVRAITQKIEIHEAELVALRKTRVGHQRDLARENELLAGQVYTAFTLGRQEKVKLLFSQQSPATLQRNLVYYEYFSNARVELINSVKDNIDAILATEAKISDIRTQQERERDALAAEKARLKKDLGKRKTIIASLDTQLKQQGGSLNRLQDEAQQLQQLIDEIQEIFDATPELDIARQPFAEQRGKLAWPVKGKVRRLFGNYKPASDLRWQGVVIEAKSGTHVRAVSHGRVAFADWLRGMGNLVIIDHGNDYLSLYGHNESLFKNAGEWVESGDIIASVGSSGGQPKAGLYFEIRKRGKPQNPTRWCSANNQFASG